jgi:dTDP-4-amino-4,6-dideoxygalactose transaminase
MDTREEKAAMRAIKSGRLSGYRANKGSHFSGGPEIQALRAEWASMFDVDKKSVIPCNSATSGLFIACAAIGLKPDDEVIVTPYSMTCSATIPIWFGARPVFADVDLDYFCIDPQSIEKLITHKTKAIIAVDLFGQPCDYKRIRQIINKHNALHGNKHIYLITDTAQAPGAIYRSDNEAKYEYAGTTGDIGVFSLNFGKHMTCGEGGVIIAQGPFLRSKCKLVVNHGESVINDLRDSQNSKHQTMVVNYRSSLGLNLRMTEIQAAIAREQLKKLEDNIFTRRYNTSALNRRIHMIPAIDRAWVRPNCTHVYYVAAYLWNELKAGGLHRDTFLDAVRAELTPREGRDGEGVQIGNGYIRPIFLMPYFNQPEWKSTRLKGIRNCLNVISLWKDRLFLTLYHAPNSTLADINSVGEAFCKVWEQRDSLG